MFLRLEEPTSLPARGRTVRRLVLKGATRRWQDVIALRETGKQPARIRRTLNTTHVFRTVPMAVRALKARENRKTLDMKLS